VAFLGKLFGRRPGPVIETKVAKQEIRAAIFPLLKGCGFDTAKGFIAWRHNPNRIDVVQLEFFTPLHHRKWGTTPASFAVELGCYFTFVPPFLDISGPPKIQDGLMLPVATRCPIRRSPNKTLRQRETRIPNIWYVDRQGAYLKPICQAVQDLLTTDLLPWFDRFQDTRELLRTLLNDDEDASTGGWGFGAKGSWARWYLIGFTAIELGERELALRALENVPQYPDVDLARKKLISARD